MKNKKWIWIVVVALLLVAALVIWKQSAASRVPVPKEAEVDAEPAAQPEATPIAAELPVEPEPSEEPVEEGSQPMVLENDGTLEIIIPDDQDSDGF